MFTFLFIFFSRFFDVRVCWASRYVDEFWMTNDQLIKFPATGEDSFTADAYLQWFEAANHIEIAEISHDFDPEITWSLKHFAEDIHFGLMSAPRWRFQNMCLHCKDIATLGDI